MIVRSTVALAHSLGLHVIAEGIENTAQLRRLRTLGCEYGQGFLFSPRERRGDPGPAGRLAPARACGARRQRQSDLAASIKTTTRPGPCASCPRRWRQSRRR